MKNELSEPAWSGYEQEIPVAQETANDLENVTCAGLSNADDRHAALDKLVNVASNYAPEVFYDWIQETGISLRAALQSPSDKRLQDHIDYSIDLQRIIESLCHGEEIIKPKTTARHHYDMAVAYKAALQSPRVPVVDGLDIALEDADYKNRLRQRFNNSSIST